MCDGLAGMQMTPAMPEAVAAFWASYVAATGVRGEPLGAFGFGDSTELADDLADLVLAGKTLRKGTRIARRSSSS